MQSVWKVWFSYLVDIPLERADTPQNPRLELCLRKGQFCLSTENAIYSYGLKYDNFRLFFERFDWSRIPADAKVLLLGFGMGSVPLLLEKRFGRRFSYLGLELDPVISNWAHRYILPLLQSPVQLETGDARAYVMDCRRKFDLVVVDIFLDDKVPPAFSQPDFLSDVKKVLKPDGLLLFNRLYQLEEDRQETTEFMEKVFKTAFPGATAVTVGGNQILKNSP
jgi:SAM-dependent methyltransferase